MGLQHSQGRESAGKMTVSGPLDLNGAQLWPALLETARQAVLLEQVRAVVRAAPLMRPVTPGGRRMSVRMSAAGRFGWVTDRRGYRYADRHPEGMDWPPIPPLALEVWRAVAGGARDPECCLVNFYGEGARMGLHQDRDEEDFAAPVVSVSLGETCVFRMGGTRRKDPTRSFRLASGDLVVLGGEARLAYHGVDRIIAGTSDLLDDWLPAGGRINLTLRRVSRPDGRLQ